jgi:co-chaperonin GroES (HSP10)
MKDKNDPNDKVKNNNTEKESRASLNDDISSNFIVSNSEYSYFENMDIKRKVRKINPLGMRVVVKIEKDAPVTDSGLYLPENAKSMTKESVLAQVIEVASAIDADTHEETNISGVPLGAKILIPREAGVKIPWDDNLRILETNEVLGIVEEITII